MCRYCFSVLKEFLNEQPVSPVRGPWSGLVDEWSVQPTPMAGEPEHKFSLQEDLDRQLSQMIFDDTPEPTPKAAHVNSSGADQEFEGSGDGREKVEGSPREVAWTADDTDRSQEGMDYAADSGATNIEGEAANEAFPSTDLEEKACRGTHGDTDDGDGVEKHGGNEEGEEDSKVRSAGDKSDGGETQWTAKATAEASGGVLFIDDVKHVMEIFHEIAKGKSGHIDLNDFKVKTTESVGLGVRAESWSLHEVALQIPRRLSPTGRVYS